VTTGGPGSDLHAPTTAAPARKALGLWTGVGLLIADTVGVGVLTNTGYMAVRLGPRQILLAWLLGGIMAMAGARCYAALAEIIPRSGGEYRYLSDLVHPFWGTLAGWTSLLVGFSAPVALIASTAGPFFSTLFPRVGGGIVSVSLIVLATVAQGFDRGWSKSTQDALALVKVMLILGFVAVGLTLGTNQRPTWQPIHPSTTGFPLRAFAVSLVYIAFAFSGWNTVTYAAGEFRNPRRTVPLAMLIGTGFVSVVYLLVNWIFVANLTGERLASWLNEDTSRITLAHLLMARLAGARAARLTSLFVVLSLASSVMSMTLIGPRVSAAMARGGFLPRFLAGEDDPDGRGRPPLAAVLLQSAIALALLATHGFEELLRSIGAILTLTSGMTVAALLSLRFRRTRYGTPSGFVVACALAYVAGSVWILWFSLTEGPFTLVWLAVVTAATAIAYAATLYRRRSRRPQ
jgi:APA family basic amino acid/polyamine antiporter